MRPHITQARIIKKIGWPRIFSHPIPRDVCMPVPRGRGMITMDCRQMPIAKAIYLLQNPGYGHPKRAKQTCNTPFCQNPHHWAFTPYAHMPRPQITEPTLQDALDLLERYLCHHPDPPINFKHDLLIDLPPALILQAILDTDKEHLL